MPNKYMFQKVKNKKSRAEKVIDKVEVSLLKLKSETNSRHQETLIDQALEDIQRWKIKDLKKVS